ncbi:histidine kinase [Prauserella marina]|uniref:HicB family protein n=1 Tax=Prauserella marina TaxID=530584 RepID=A0A222VWI7_9PSEU|nr:toxin-antitoxin system HicB family antitoxin [Prauserella marina]ASR38081.1 histidine kinase [Prauserella marina]PWV78765.1 HicB-like protein involved in pilus formation [Prauserella marina]SDC93101.1 HicB family protein [Prauserella marina]
MDLTPYVENLRHELAVAADVGGEDARTLAERLTAPLESAARLMLLEALTAAAEEITRDLAPGSVDVRLRGLKPSFVVSKPQAGSNSDQRAEPESAHEVPPAPVEIDEGGDTLRINLRVPERLKGRIEEVAAKEGLSVNAWLVRVVAAATNPEQKKKRAPSAFPSTGQRYTGWVR